MDFPSNTCRHSAFLLFGLLSACYGEAPPDVRVATFNVSLSPNSPTALSATLADANSADPKKIAEIIQRVAPDVLFLNELNYEGTSANLDALHDNFIAVSQNGQPAQSYPHRFVAISNTGVHSGLDFDNSGSINANPGSDSYGNDCYGFGRFPGQFAMAVLSKYPIRVAEVRTLANFLWRDMPGALLPEINGFSWYSAVELDAFRLSSKSHWDIPIEVGGHVVHLLGSHPTPPTFDGSEDRNGKRNHDEIRLWADYIDPSRAGYIYDDAGGLRGLGADRRFVIAGDNNADPEDGDSVSGAAQQYTEHPLINSALVPSSSGGGTDTAEFAGGLRVDYVLPSEAGFAVVGGGVFWPASGEDGRSLVSVSDHRMVYMDLELTPLLSMAVADLAIAVEGVDVVLSWTASEGVGYSVLASDNLAESSWTPVPEMAVEIDAGVARAVDSGAAAGGGRRFYKVGAAFE
jgi:hypothetical protein